MAAARALLVLIKKLPSLLLAVYFTYVFVASSLVVTILSLILLFLWPVAATTYRRITSGLAYTVLGQIAWICTDYASIRVHTFGEAEAYERLGKDFQIIVSSHRGNLDWVAGFMLGLHYGFLHSIRSLPKRSVWYVPGFGQLLWALEYPFLHRNNYQKDRETIKKFAETWESYPFPIQVAIYCEGTRFTKEKQDKSHEYARAKGLPILKHHLTPRTKGFALLAEYLRGNNFKAVLDVAVAYPDATSSTPTHLDILMGETMDIFWYMRKIPMKNLPETHEELNKFCYEMYQHKDEAYEHFVQHKEFPKPLNKKLPPLGYKLWRLRVLMLIWALLLTVLPLYTMSLIFSFTTNALIIASFLFSNLILFAGMIIYAKGKSGKKER